MCTSREERTWPRVSLPSIAEGGRVRRLPDPEPVADDDDRAAERAHQPSHSPIARRASAASGEPARVFLMTEPRHLPLRVAHRLLDDITLGIADRLLAAHDRARLPISDRPQRTKVAADSARGGRAPRRSGRPRTSRACAPPPRHGGRRAAGRGRPRSSAAPSPAGCVLAMVRGERAAAGPEAPRARAPRARGPSSRVRAAASGSTRASMRCSVASPRRSATFSRRRRRSASRDGPANRPRRRARRYSPVPPATIGSRPRATISSMAARARRA